nr:hypothetical protein [Sphingomonas sanguinis]
MWVVGVDPERRTFEIVEELFDILVAQSFALYLAYGIDGLTVGQELHRADAIPTDAGQEAVWIGTFGTCALRHAASDIGAVGEQVVENGEYRCAAIGGCAKRQR